MMRAARKSMSNDSTRIAAKPVVIPMLAAKLRWLTSGRTKPKGAYQLQAGRCCMRVACRDDSVAKDEWSKRGVNNESVTDGDEG